MTEMADLVVVGLMVGMTAWCLINLRRGRLDAALVSGVLAVVFAASRLFVADAAWWWLWLGVVVEVAVVVGVARLRRVRADLDVARREREQAEQRLLSELKARGWTLPT